jgi:hypothetical protein
MDNLETNTKAMEELASLLSDREISFDAKDRRVMCFPHIINIICQHVIAKMSNFAPPEQDDDDGNETDPVEDDTIVNAANTRQAVYDRDPIARCRRIVVAIRSSGQRRERFESWIKTGQYLLSWHSTCNNWILNES